MNNATDKKVKTSTRKKQTLITQNDYDRLIEIIRQGKSLGTLSVGSLEKIGEELKKARIIEQAKIPADVVTMNSKVEITDMATHRKMTLQLTYPDSADIKQQKISVFAPVGTALIGYRAGDEIAWEVPGGKKVFKINNVVYQPEAAGDFHL
ncbi:MAG TPA: nucleoside diphosphate kinase regulator [Chitinophagaceae bacterium]